jgi:hypothetical protein
VCCRGAEAHLAAPHLRVSQGNAPSASLALSATGALLWRRRGRGTLPGSNMHDSHSPWRGPLLRHGAEISPQVQTLYTLEITAIHGRLESPSHEEPRAVSCIRPLVGDEKKDAKAGGMHLHLFRRGASDGSQTPFRWTRTNMPDVSLVCRARAVRTLLFGQDPFSPSHDTVKRCNVDGTLLF